MSKVIYGLIAIPFLVSGFAVCTSCTSLDKAKDYTDDLQRCLIKSADCEEYVSCRKEVAEKYGREFKGSCDPLGRIEE